MNTQKDKPNACRNASRCGAYAQLRWLTRSLLERGAIESDSLVEEDQKVDCRNRVLFLGYGAGIWEASTPNLKYKLIPIVEKYRERKLKNILHRR